MIDSLLSAILQCAMSTDGIASIPVLPPSRFLLGHERSVNAGRVDGRTGGAFEYTYPKARRKRNKHETNRLGTPSTIDRNERRNSPCGGKPLTVGNRHSRQTARVVACFFVETRRTVRLCLTGGSPTLLVGHLESTRSKEKYKQSHGFSLVEGRCTQDDSPYCIAA